MYNQSESQMTLYDYAQPFEGKLDESNRWVQLAHAIPWQELEQEYSAGFGKAGHKAFSVRIAFGSLVIRQAMGLSDRQTVQLIRENPYLQYFIGMTQFSHEAPFSAHSMVGFRQRFTLEQVEQAVSLWKKFSRQNLSQG